MSAHDQPGPSTSRDCAIDELSAQDQPGPSAGRVRAIDEMTAYERDRLQNIKDIYEQFGGLFQDVQKSVEVLQSSTKSSSALVKTNTRKRTQSWRTFKLGSRPKLFPDDNVRQSIRMGSKKEVTKHNELSDSDDEPKKIKIKFPFVGDKTSEKHTKIKRRPGSRKPRKGRQTLLVSDVTKEMLGNIAHSSSGKIISDDGTTCHQCRQKTLDQKSYCRHKLCVGIRGMFCGLCLGNRYGEDVADVLQNPDWICPVCRNECNCSICRRKRGQGPTGQMKQLATAKGYKSVMHYLCDNEEKLLEGSANSVSENDSSNDLNLVEQEFTDSIKSENKIVLEQSDELVNIDFVEMRKQQDSPETILNKLYQEHFSNAIDYYTDDDFDLY